MKKPSKEKLTYYFEEAKTYKDDIKGDYNETFELTDTSFTIKDDASRQKSVSRKVDSVVLESQRFLSNFIMISVFPKSQKWAELKSNLDVIKAIEEVNDNTAEMIKKELDEILEENSETVYRTNSNTNYYTEVAKSVSDCLKVGTGIFKIIELNSTAKPFTYSYQNLDNIFFLEDMQGKPNIVFKRYVEKNLQDLIDLFGHLNFKKPGSLNNEEELTEKISVIETVIAEFDEKKAVNIYHHFVHTEEFEEELVYEVLEYNPYVIFRWQVDSSNPWGIGIGRANKHLIKQLNENIEKRARHRDKIVDPPANFYGDISLRNKVSLKPGAINYGGEWNDANKMGIQPINLGTNLIPIEQDINDCRERIRKAYMAQPLGDVLETKNRSATEMELRQEMFRSEFSGTYELINTELLEPIFMNAYYILEKKGLLNTLENEDYVTHSKIHYVNELTQNSGREYGLRIIDFYNMASQLVPEEQRGFIIKSAEAVEDIRDKMNIPASIVNSKDEIIELVENQRKLLEIETLAQAQENVGKRQETGIPERVKQGVGGLGDI